MRERAYELRGVDDEIYCSSSGDHWIHIIYRFRGKRVSGDWYFEGDCLETFSDYYAMPPLQIKYPAYFIEEVRAEILKRLPTAKVFEYDRDQNKRYTDLRYHPDDWIQRTIEQWDAKS